MRRYRCYMDRIHVSPGFHRRLLDSADIRRRTAAGTRRSRLTAGLGGLAACCVLAALGIWQLWLGGTAQGPVPSVGTAATPALSSPPAYEATLTVGPDPFEGQPHSRFPVTTLSYPDCTHSEQMMPDFSMPEGYFQEEMTADEIIRALGGADEVPWTLNWYGFGLDGLVIYDGQGQVWLAVLTGSRGDESLRLELSPSQIPPNNVIFADAAEQDVDGVSVTTFSLTGFLGRSAEGTALQEMHTFCAEFMAGETGVCFSYTGPDKETAAALSDALVWYATRSDCGFTTSHLTPESIPEWRSEELSLEQARAEELGAYLPAAQAIPDSFRFECAHRELGQDRDFLSAGWTHAYDSIHVTVYRNSTEQADLKAAEVCADTLAPLGTYVSDGGDIPTGWRWISLRIGWDSGVVAEYSLSGITLEQAAALIPVDPFTLEDAGSAVPPVSTENPLRIHPISGQPSPN